MPRHNVIIKLGIALGYFNDDNLAGVCHGANMAWTEAFMLEEEHMFDERVEYITSLNNPTLFIDQLQIAQEKVKNKEVLTSQEAELFNIFSYSRPN